MTDERRRFFPAKGAQTVPGATAQVQVQLQPPAGEAAPAASFAADIAGPALLPEWRYMMEASRWAIHDAWYSDVYPEIIGYSSTPPDESWSIDDNGYYRPDAYTAWERVEVKSSINHGSGYELPACTFSADGRMTRAWVNLGYIKRPLRFRAVLLGRAMSDVKWTAELDASAPWTFQKPLGQLWPGGVDVEDEGHSLLIRVHPGKAGAGGVNAAPWAATLTMTASAGGKEVGTLELRLGWRQKRAAIAEQGERYAMHDWEGWKPQDAEETVP